jgi:hypothetical protein
VAGPAGGAVVLDLGGHTLHAPAGGRPGPLQLLAGGVPPAGLRSLALRNGTLALRPGMGVAFGSWKHPFAVSLEHIKLTRPAPGGSSSAGASTAPGAGSVPMVVFPGTVNGRMVQCRVELSPAGRAGHSHLQGSVGISAQVGNAGWRGGSAGTAT